MSDIRRNADRNRAIQAMMTDGEQLKTFYSFVANNPHIALHDACQIVIERPNASVCFSFEEWNAQGRRVTKGRKGIPYYDSDGNKYFVFDVADTHGENRYRRIRRLFRKIQVATERDKEYRKKATASSRSQKKNYFNKSNKYPSSDLCFP